MLLEIKTNSAQLELELGLSLAISLLGIYKQLGALVLGWVEVWHVLFFHE